MRVYVHCLVAAFLGATVAWGQAVDEPRDQTQVEQGVAEEGVEVLTRGPVHEAFAETVTFDPEPGVVVEKPAPEAIEELPPEQRPEGDNVAWIPGYWAWDDERSDFLWVSGIWRALPPGRQWVPGYWGETDQGYQWTSGYWADAEAGEIEYLPEPPATVEDGPNIAAPSADHNWAPGCWVWSQGRYAWRPGYWATAQPDWTWIPAHYVWAPRGYVFVDGYYDYSVDRRGVLFAPVYFNASVYSRQGFSYSPATVINPAVFVSQLFLRPRYQHYYFGDYYAASYSSAGFHPWFSYNSSRYGYDPIYAHQRWHHRHDREWEDGVKADYSHRRDHEDARPPRTWKSQRALIAKEAGSKEKSVVIAAPLDQLAKSKDGALRFQAVDKEERQKLAKHGQEMQKFRSERQRLETRTAGTSAADPATKADPAKVKLPKSPFVARSADQLGKDHAPPKRHEVLKPNLQIEPKPRKAGGGVDSPNKEAKAESKPEPRKALKPEPEPSKPTKPESRPESPKANKPASKSEPRKALKPESKPEPRKEIKPESKPEPPKANKPQSKPAPSKALKPETRPDPPKANKPESRPEPRKAFKPESRPEPPKANKPQSKPAPRKALKPETRPDPPKANKPESRPEPRKAFKPESRPEPPKANKPQSKPAPSKALKPETRPDPPKANKPESRPDPRKENKREGKDDSRGESKDKPKK